MKAPFSWREEIFNKPGVVPPFSLDPESTALVVVDLRNVPTAEGSCLARLFAREHTLNHAYYFQGIETEVIPRAAAPLAAFRDARRRVIHLIVGSHLSGTTSSPSAGLMTNACAWRPHRTQGDHR